MQKLKSKNKYFSSFILYSLFSILLFPLISFAQPLTTFSATGTGYADRPGCSAQGLANLICGLTALIVQAIPIVFGLALLFFFWGVALYISRAGDETQAKKGKSIMIYGVIALFVMFSIWGIIKFIGGDLGLSQSDITNINQRIQQ